MPLSISVYFVMGIYLYDAFYSSPKTTAFCMKFVSTAFSLDNNAFNRLITDICCIDIMIVHPDGKHLAI